MKLLRNYPSLYEIGRNFQRKYVSKFNLDNFQINNNQVINNNDLPEYKFKKGILSKGTIQEKTSQMDDIMEKEINNWTRSHGGNWNSHQFNISDKTR